MIESVVEGFGDIESDAASVGSAPLVLVADGITPLDAESVGVALFEASVDGVCESNVEVAPSVGNGVAPADATDADGDAMSLDVGVAESLVDADVIGSADTDVADGDAESLADADSVGVADPLSVGFVAPESVGVGNGDEEPAEVSVAIGVAESDGNTPVALAVGSGVADGKTISGPFASMMSSSSAMSTVI